MGMRATHLAFAWLGGLLAIAPCAHAQKPLVVGVSTIGLRFPYASALSRGEHKAAAEAGARIVELDANVDLLKQANDVDRLISSKVDGIVVVPMDSTAAEGWADKAKAAGIPMVSDAVWVGNTDEHEVPWVYPSLVALADRDDIQQAYALGKVAAAEHPDGAKVAVVEGLPGFAAVAFRNKGFEKALSASGKRFDIVFRQPANWDPELAGTVCQNAMSAHPDITMIFSHDQAMAQGCLSALDDADGHIRIYTIDSSHEIVDMIRDGKPIVTTCSLPETNGYNAMKVLIDYIRLGTKPKDPFVTYQWSTVSKDTVASCQPQF